jgi:predicted type IV restriction endonuclease
VSVADSIPKALASVAKLEASGSINEANTKAHVVEPLLSALGWDPLDIDSVDREVRVYDARTWTTSSSSKACLASTSRRRH